ncbi:hypothetical protein [Oceanobacillus sp. CAU 1775]
MESNPINYLLNKTAALGFLVFIMCSYALLATGFDLYEFVKTIANLKFWLYISGYALLVTILIDFVDYKWKKLTTTHIMLLHTLAGFVAFFPIVGLNPIAIIAGFVGALCAFIYALGSYFFKRKKKLAWLVLLVFPLLFGVSTIDFTEKEQWDAQVTDSSYSATFEYFNGKHEIPLNLEKGDKVKASVAITVKNAGGHGHHVRDEKNNLVPMQTLEDTRNDYEKRSTHTYEFVAEKEGEHKIVVTGDDLRGKIEVEWEIE